jgi:hypothetical protein
MVTVKRGSKKITRNISFFKKIDNRATDSSDDEDDDDDFDCDRTNEDQHNQEPANQIDLDLNIELSMTIDTYCMLTVEICFSLNSYRSFSSDVTAAILVYQNNEMAAILVYGTGISSFLFKYLVLFHHPTGATDHVSENDLLSFRTEETF